MANAYPSIHDSTHRMAFGSSLHVRLPLTGAGGTMQACAIRTHRRKRLVITNVCVYVCIHIYGIYINIQMNYFDFYGANIWHGGHSTYSFAGRDIGKQV